LDSFEKQPLASPFRSFEDDLAAAVKAIKASAATRS
jgi:hypothetical protein